MLCADCLCWPAAPGSNVCPGCFQAWQEEEAALFALELERELELSGTQVFRLPWRRSVVRMAHQLRALRRGRPFVVLLRTGIPWLHRVTEQRAWSPL